MGRRLTDITHCEIFGEGCKIIASMWEDTQITDRFAAQSVHKGCNLLSDCTVFVNVQDHESHAEPQGHR